YTLISVIDISPKIPQNIAYYPLNLNPANGERLLFSYAYDMTERQLYRIGVTLCIPGFGLNDQGVCQICDAGTYSDESNSTPCKKCTQGTYSEFVSGSTKCIECPRGTYSDKIA